MGTPLKQTATNFFDAMNTRDASSVASMLAEDAVFHFPGTAPMVGVERIQKFLKVLFFKFPRLEFSVGRVVADESAAAVEWTNRGERRDGAPYANAGVTVLALEGDRIVYLSDTFKDTSFTG
jgi:uncharacterized protein (TIGR02246 family)